MGKKFKKCLKHVRVRCRHKGGRDEETPEKCNGAICMYHSINGINPNISEGGLIFVCHLYIYHNIAESSLFE